MSVRQMPTALMATRTSPPATVSGSGGACSKRRRMGSGYHWCVAVRYMEHIWQISNDIYH